MTKPLKPAPVPICKLCAHCENPDTVVREMLRCRLSIEPVLGMNEQCLVVRGSRNGCGARGAWYEKRERV